MEVIVFGNKAYRSPHWTWIIPFIYTCVEAIVTHLGGHDTTLDKITLWYPLSLPWAIMSAYKPPGYEANRTRVVTIKCRPATV